MAEEEELLPHLGEDPIPHVKPTAYERARDGLFNEYSGVPLAIFHTTPSPVNIQINLRYATLYGMGTDLEAILKRLCPLLAIGYCPQGVRRQYAVLLLITGPEFPDTRLATSLPIRSRL